MAGALKWSCWATAAHVAHDLLAYAAQVAVRATDGYLPFDLVVAPESSPRDVLEVVTACGRLLSGAVANAATGPVAWHCGMSDAAESRWIVDQRASKRPFSIREMSACGTPDNVPSSAWVQPSSIRRSRIESPG